MVKFIIVVLVLVSVNLFLTNNLMCQENEHLIKIINETDLSEVSNLNIEEKDKEIVQRTTETNFSMDNAQNSDAIRDAVEKKHILLKDDPGNYEEKSQSYSKFTKELDRKKIGQELYVALLNSFKDCNMLTKDEARGYIVYFNVESAQRDEDTGILYAWKVDYQIVKEGKILYKNHFLPARKKAWFSNMEYYQLVRPKIIAQQITTDLCKSISK